MPKGGAAIFVSQSGETADTLAALRYARAQGQKIIAVVNQPESSIAREADIVLSTLAGPEIGVASTKAFTTQLAVLASFTVALARARGAISHAREAELVSVMIEIPSRASEVLNQNERIQEIAAEIALARDVLYLGRGSVFPLALEGALKLKEISYIHAEGYPAGELKHGPIALVEPGVPVVAVEGDEEIKESVDHVLYVPQAPELLLPILEVVPLQLLAYHIAVRRGCDVDQPRNLAKSVTVE